MTIKPLLEDRQQSTMIEVREQLKTYGKSIFIRPTGFGKTYLLIEELAKKYIKKYPNKKVLYIYPLDIIVTEIIGDREVKRFVKSKDTGEKIEITDKIKSKYLTDGVIKLKKNFQFISYQKLSLEYNKDNEYWHNKLSKENISLIILDEAHRAGSEEFYRVWDSIKDLVGPDKIHVVGATATPNRMDDSDEKESVLEYIFDNRQAYEYNLGDAFNEGLIPEMIYEVNQFAVELAGNKLRKRIKESHSNVVEQNFNVEISRLRGTIGDEKNIIAKSISEAGYNPVNEKYYKFIVFFINKEDMVDNAKEVEEWFEEAFNNVIVQQYGLKNKFNMRVSYLTSQDEDGELKKLASSSSNRHYYNKTKMIEELREEVNTVDLIFTIDMVNMGYHVPNITGILMKRGTKSEITYYQQLGRALSVAATHRPIVLDFVGNVNEKFWFKKDAERRGTDNIQQNDNTERDTTGLSGIDLRYLGTMSAFTQFMERFNGESNPFDKQEIEMLYNEMEMPLYMIAAIKSWTLKELVSKLKKYKIAIRSEENQYNLLMDKIEFYIKQGNKEKAREIYKVLPYINYKEATYNGSCQFIKNKQTPTLYDILHK